MAAKYHGSLWRHLKQPASVLGIVALSVLTTLLVQRALTPPRAAAQADQAQVVRASGFELVRSDGTVVARLTAGAGGGGNLTLFDATGTMRLEAAAAGFVRAYDPDGVTLRFSAGYSPLRSPAGVPPVNGVLLGPDGTVGILSGCTGPTVIC